MFAHLPQTWNWIQGINTTRSPFYKKKKKQWSLHVYSWLQYAKERDKMMEAYFVCSFIILICMLIVQYIAVPQYKTNDDEGCSQLDYGRWQLLLLMFQIGCYVHFQCHMRGDPLLDRPGGSCRKVSRKNPKSVVEINNVEIAVLISIFSCSVCHKA